MSINVPIFSYSEYRYQNNKLYCFEEIRRDNTGLAYFVWAFAGLSSYPGVLGVITLIASTDAYFSDREKTVGAIGYGVSATEFYLQTLPDRTASYYFNGAIATLGLLSPLIFQEKPEEYPPKKIFISPGIFYNWEKKLDYDDAKAICFELMDQGLISQSLNSAEILSKYSPTTNIVLTEKNTVFEPYVNTILREIFMFNKTGKSDFILFSKPPTSDIKNKGS